MVMGSPLCSVPVWRYWRKQSTDSGRWTPNWTNPSPPRRRGPLSARRKVASRSEEHTSELQSLMRISYAVFFLKKKKKTQRKNIKKTKQIKQNKKTIK